jgi:predicted ATPase/class 3 adenylate cyclase
MAAIQKPADAVPSGTVTFLFTDIQGSTRLWESYPQAMKTALARHDEVMGYHIRSHGGYVFKTVGDAFCAAFSSAVSALKAAAAIQLALRQESWPEGIEILVRMGMHSGQAELRDGDYFGTPVNKAARIESAGHGGQVLLSSATAELIREGLRDGYSLQDMGAHRLKDLRDSERLFQLLIPGLPADFPALRTLSAQRTNLPASLTAIVGREREISELMKLIRREDVRLVTLSGPGGTGKTTLSLEVARLSLGDFENGVFFVELETIAEPDLVPVAIARVQGIPISSDWPAVDQLCEKLEDHQALLVLDNFEQVTEAAPHIKTLLQRCPGIQILISSRHILRLDGEHEYPVPTMGIPEATRNLTPAVAQQYEAVSLFIERARSVKPDFALDSDNLQDVMAICRQLDGMPLAIELAASRIRMLGPGKILERLHNSIDFLKRRGNSVVKRQSSMEAAIDWSFDLLEPEEREAFLRFGQCRGGWSINAAEDLLADLESDPFELLESLIDKSLVRMGRGETGEERYFMLNVLAEYCRNRGSALSDQREFLLRYCAHYTGQMRIAMDTRFSEIGAILRDEGANVEYAMDWCTRHGEIDAFSQMLGIVYNPWFAYKTSRDQVDRWLAALLGIDGMTDYQRARLLRFRGVIEFYDRRMNQARDSFIEAKHFLPPGNPEDEAAIMNNLALVYSHLGMPPEEVLELHDACHRLRLEIGSVRSAAQSSANTATLLRSMGRFEEARRAFERMEDEARTADDPMYVSWARRGQAEIMAETGELSQSANIAAAELRNLWNKIEDISAVTAYVILAGRIALQAGRRETVALIAGMVASLEERGVSFGGDTDVLVRFKTESDELAGSAGFDSSRESGMAMSDPEKINSLLSFLDLFGGETG